MPLGPYILWADRLIRSTFQAATSTGMRPTAWTASQWKTTPRSRQRAPTSATGCSVPTSLFAAIIETRIVSGRSAAATSPASTRPSGVRRRRASPRSRRARGVRQGSSTAGCSIAVVTRWRARPRAARATPRIARLFDSVAPEVKTISSAAAPMRPATCSRADSTAACASWPKTWLRLEGLPKRSAKYGSIAVEHGGSTGVVA